jgi:hypothetical protein
LPCSSITGHEEGPLQVHVEAAIPVVFRQLVDCTYDTHPSVVVQDIEPTVI